MTLTTKNHSEVVEGSRHAPHNLTYPDAANRIAGTNEGKGIVVDATNMYQLAKQDDDDTLWMMVDDAPLTWLQINTGVPTTLDDGYGNFGASPADVEIDNAEGQGSLIFHINDTFQFVVDVSDAANPQVNGATDPYGFEYRCGADFLKVGRLAADQLMIYGEMAYIDLNLSGNLDVDIIGTIAIDGSDTIEWSGTNAALTSAGALSIDGDFTLTAGGSILSTANTNILITPHGTGITVIGTGAGSHSLNAPGDLFVSGECEIDGPLWVDSTSTFAADVIIGDQVDFAFGSGKDSQWRWSTVQTAQTLLAALNDVSNSIIFTQNADRTVNFEHAAQANPTIFIQSADATTVAQWGSLAHNQTSFVIGSGTSLLLQGATNENIFLTPQGTGITVIGTGAGSHSLNAPGDLFVSGKLEVDDVFYADLTSIFAGQTTHDGGIVVKFDQPVHNSSGAYGGLILRNTAQTVDSAFITTGTALNAWVMCENADIGYDWAFAQQASPTFYFCGPTQNTTFWGSATFNDTDFVLNAGAGTIRTARSASYTPDAITATSETVAASVATVITEITTNGDTDTDDVSLAAGVDGQIKIFAIVAVGNAGDSVKITPASMIGGTQITFAANPLGLGCSMVYDAGAAGWIVTGNNGGTVA